MNISKLFASATITFLCAVGSSHAESDHQISGRRVAERNCGSCHAIGHGRSPLPKAPPFAQIHRRYPIGGLDQILSEGMIAPRNPPEEGPVLLHPSMPMAVLAEDEISDLRAYMKSLEPLSRGARHAGKK